MLNAVGASCASRSTSFLAERDIGLSGCVLPSPRGVQILPTGPSSRRPSLYDSPRSIPRPVSPAASRAGDLVALFGERGPCAGCWCMWWRVTASQFGCRAGGRTPRRPERLVATGRRPGLLARDGIPVGRVALAPRTEYGRLQRSPKLKPVDDTPVWSTVCAHGSRRAPVGMWAMSSASLGSRRRQRLTKSSRRVLMSATEPMVKLDARFSSEGARARPWSEVEDVLKQSEIFWLSTVRRDGRPT
jgi:hypothetical protein